MRRARTERRWFVAYLPHYHTLNWRAVGMALGLFFVITYVLCVVFDLVFPGMAMYESWMRLLPGFTWLTWGSFLLGLAESFAYGFYVSLVFCPLYNYYSGRFESKHVAHVAPERE